MDPVIPSTPGGTASPTPAPAPPSGSGAGGSRTLPLPQLLVELRDLVITYVKQQTIVPLQRLGRYVGFGLLGSLLLGFGVVFLGMSGLRALQTETGSTFTGDWSWVPYLIMVVVLIVGAAVIWVLRGPGRVQSRGEKGTR